MIEKKEYISRRQELMSMMHKNSIAVISSAPEKVRSRDTNYPYKQNVNLTYLAGFPEPDSVLVLIPDREDGQVILFCRDKDPLRETWDGYREGPVSAIKKYGFDDAFPISDIDDILPNLIEGKDRLYYAVGKDAEFDKRIMDWVNHVKSQRGNGALPPGEFVDLDHFMNEMRLIKTKSELEIMKKAAKVSGDAHKRAMKFCKPGILSLIHISEPTRL